VLHRANKIVKISKLLISINFYSNGDIESNFTREEWDITDRLLESK
jgi:hypothetical protein